MPHVHLRTLRSVCPSQSQQSLLSCRVLCRGRFSVRSLAALAWLVSAFSCVSTSRYQDLQSRYDRLQTDCATRQAQAQRERKDRRSELESRRKEHELGLRACRAKLQTQRAASEERGEELRGLQERYSKVVNDRAALRFTAQQLRESYGLLRKRESAQRERSAKRHQLEASLRAWIEQEQLELQERGDALILIMPADPLFSLGAAQLSSQGRTQLRALGRELLRVFGSAKRCLQVQGHSDNVPKRTATIRNNWELSAARALAVVERFIEAGMAPAALSASAFASFQPRADNATRQGRALNRRIEIVVYACDSRTLAD